MIEALHVIAGALGSTALDVLPIAVILFGFQFLYLRRRPANLKRILIGFIYGRL